MTSNSRESGRRLVVRAAVIGLFISAALNLLILFVPMPDVLTQGVIYLQLIGLLIELRRATPYQESALYPFLTNAAVYALIALPFLFIRRRRLADSAVRAA